MRMRFLHYKDLKTIMKNNHLGIRANESDTLARINLGTAKAAQFSPITTKQ